MLVRRGLARAYRPYGFVSDYYLLRVGGGYVFKRADYLRAADLLGLAALALGEQLAPRKRWALSRF